MDFQTLDKNTEFINFRRAIARKLGHLEPMHISSNVTEKNGCHRLQEKAFDRKLQGFEAISCVVLYDTARKSKGKFFEVDRLIEKRKVGHVSTTCHNKMFSRFI